MSDSASFSRSIQSMTGYASTSCETALGQLVVEWRSVNSRFLDIALRMPDELRPAEPALRAALTSRIKRGKVECRVALRARQGASPSRLDDKALEQLIAAVARIQAKAPGLAAPTVGDLLRFPGLLVETESPDSLVEQLVRAGGQLLDEFVGSRVREGNRLISLIRERLDAMHGLVEALKTRTPALLGAYERRLTERIQLALEAASDAARVPIDETMARIRQEVTAYGLRIDVAEEIDRLLAHIDECRRILNGPGPVGKRLDFMVQELNREANTLGSKAAAVDLTQSAVELKVLIEQIREQLQNLE